MTRGILFVRLRGSEREKRRPTRASAADQGVHPPLLRGFFVVGGGGAEVGVEAEIVAGEHFGEVHDLSGVHGEMLDHVVDRFHYRNGILLNE